MLHDDINNSHVNVIILRVNTSCRAEGCHQYHFDNCKDMFVIIIPNSLQVVK